MSQEESATPQGDLPQPERIPFFQRLLDNPFLLPTVFYIMWGIMEVATLPVAP